MYRKPLIDIKIIQERRKKISAPLKNSTLVLFASPEFIRNDDVHFEYRQDSNFFYLTGFEEPESVFVFRPGRSPETILFVRAKDPLRETWDGFRYGPKGAKKSFEVDEAFEISELDKKLPELLSDSENIYYSLNKREKHDAIFLMALKNAKNLFPKRSSGQASVLDSEKFLSEFRLIKDKYEIEVQRKACEITAHAHNEAMKYVQPKMNEKEIEGFLDFQFKKGGGSRLAYTSIVASGDHATALHYIFNDGVCKSGDLLLIDAGAEYQYLSGDITRTFPISGSFSKVQKEFYNHVLRAQKEVVAMVKPGIAHGDLQEKTTDLLVEALIDLRLLSGKKQEIIKSGSYRKYYPHGVSHWLGMDVHDTGSYQVRGKSRELEPGMVFTVEPGLYVPANDSSAPKELRGLGVRIEDNILVTKKGFENLTSKAIKEVSEIEKLMNA